MDKKSILTKTPTYKFFFIRL